LLSKCKPDIILLDQFGRAITEHRVLSNKNIDIFCLVLFRFQLTCQVRDISRNHRDRLIHPVLVNLIVLISPL
jgi:hypothetical protein